jgi:uncharacterized protein with HEPN domain
MRNVLAHGYAEVHANIVWNAVRHDLPALLRYIDELTTQMRVANCAQ